MAVEKDYEELLELFNKHRVKYCIVGAYAVARHAIPRFTKDLDLLVEPSRANGERVVQALEAFGFRSLKLTAEDFARPDCIVQLGDEPLRIDLITSISGCTFAQVWKGRIHGTYGQQRVAFIGLTELLRNKRASGRTKDLADLEILQRQQRAHKRKS